MDVKLPRLAEGVDSGTVVSILVSEGQEIKKDQPFIELETQKAVGSIPSPESGTVSKIHVKEGMEVAVGQLLISISADKDSASRQAGNGGASECANSGRAPGTNSQSNVADEHGSEIRPTSGGIPVRVQKRRSAARLPVDSQNRR